MNSRNVENHGSDSFTNQRISFQIKKLQVDNPNQERKSKSPCTMTVAFESEIS